MYRKPFLLFLFILFVILNLQSVISPLAAQNKTIDSLLMLLAKEKSDTNKATHLYKLCWEYQSTGNYDTAFRYGNAALQLSKQLNFLKGIAASYNNIGMIYFNQGDNSKALENHFASLKIREAIGNKQGVAASYNNIGMIYFNQGEYDHALKNYFTALKIREETGDKEGIATSYNNIGIIYTTQKNYDQALKSHFASLKIRGETGDKQGIAASYNNIGMIFFNQGEYDHALENHFASLKIREAIGDKRGIATSYINIATSYTGKSKYAEALPWFQKGLRLAKEIGAKDLIILSYQGLSDMSEKTNDYKNAYKYYHLCTQITDSLFNENSSKQIAELQTKYDTEKKDKQINLLEKEKKIQSLELSKQQEQAAKDKVIRNSGILVFLLLMILGWVIYSRHRLKEKTLQAQQNAELEMKALRAQMNPHFIFNSLASIQQFIYSQNPDAANEYLSRFSRLIRMIFDHSLEKNISLADDLEALKLYMELEQLRLDGKFDYRIHIEPGIDTEEMEIPPLIMQPFVENAIWHGISQLQDKGLIDIWIKMNTTGKSNRLECVVKDNGIGRDLSEKNKRQKNPEHQSKGMSITKERLELLNSMYGNENSVEIIDLHSESNEPCGTEIRIFIPIES